MPQTAVSEKTAINGENLFKKKINRYCFCFDCFLELTYTLQIDLDHFLLLLLSYDIMGNLQRARDRKLYEKTKIFIWMEGVEEGKDEERKF